MNSVLFWHSRLGRCRQLTKVPRLELFRCVHCSLMHYATMGEKSQSDRQRMNKSLTDNPERSYLEEILAPREQEPKTTGQKVKRAAETTFYVSFGLVSAAALCVLVYYVFKEFFDFSTPQGMYSDATKRLKKDERCRELFGSRMLTFGEESGRGRRRHIAHHKYIKEGQQRLRIMFHVKGDKAIGRVHAEIANGENGWEYRYLLVETDVFPKQTVVIIDNR